VIIDDVGLYRTVEGRPVQICGLGAFAAAGYIGPKKKLLWNRETGRLIPVPRQNHDRLRIATKVKLHGKQRPPFCGT